MGCLMSVSTLKLLVVCCVCGGESVVCGMACFEGICSSLDDEMSQTQGAVLFVSVEMLPVALF